MWGDFRVVDRRRPWALIAPSMIMATGGPGPGSAAVPQPAPYVASVAHLTEHQQPVRLELASGAVRLTGRYDPDTRTADLVVEDPHGAVVSRSRRRGRLSVPPQQLAVTLTGTHLTLFTGDADRWAPRARVDLGDRTHPVDTRTPEFLERLVASWSGPVARVDVGAFGQLGLRDLRFATTPTGEPVTVGEALLLTATHAGPGFFDAAHTGVWSLHPRSYELTHLADIFFTRAGQSGVFGDHSTHLVRDGQRWLVATATWGDFAVPPSPGELRRRAAAGLPPYDAARVRVEITLAETDADLTSGRHVLATRPLLTPDDLAESVAVWDPHLVHDGERWLMGLVTARKFFSFRPALAIGASLDELTVAGTAPGRVATEGSTLLNTEDGWRILASDGRDGRRGMRKQYPVFDLDFRQVGSLRAPYGSNLPWPNLIEVHDGWLLATFDGTAWGESLLGYGTHGDVVIMRG